MYQTDSLTPDRLLAGTNPGEYKAKGVEILATAGALVRGTVLGKITKGTPVGAEDEGNTGDAEFGATIALGTRAKLGVYTAEVIELLGAKVKGTATKTGTGNGTLTFTSIDQDAKIGNYVATCIAEAENGGTFLLRDPDGADVGTITVGTPFDNGLIAVTIADGTNDWDIGDTVTFPVEWDTDLSRFSVIDPEGVRLADGFVGTAYEGDIEFTIVEGSTHSALSDLFTVTVPAGSGKFKKANSANVDGSQEVDCILCEDVDATLAAVVTSAYIEGEFNENAMTFGGADTADTHREALRLKGIILRDSVVAA